METTIYKPSIYKGAGIYNTGAEGGGGGSVDSQNIGLYLKTSENSITIDIGQFNTGTAFVNIGVRFLENSETSKGVFELKNNGVGGLGFVSIKNGVSSTTLDGRWGAGDVYQQNKPSGNTYNSIWNVFCLHKNFPEQGVQIYNEYANKLSVYSHADDNKDFNQITLYPSEFEIYFVRIKDNSKDLFFYPYKNEGITNGLIEINSGEFIEILNSFVMPYSY